MKKNKIIIICAIFIFMFSSCLLTNNSVLVKEKYINKGFDISFYKWNDYQKCEIYLNSGDILNIDIDCSSGSIDFKIVDSNENIYYVGNNQSSAQFYCTADNTGRCYIKIIGNRASGKIIIEKIGKK